MDAFAVVGRIVRAHGIRGAVLAKPGAYGVDVLLGLDAVTVRQGGDVRLRRLVASAIQGPVVRLQLEGLTDRNAAEALVGAELVVRESELPPAEEGEFYRHELIGLEVVAKSDGAPRGTVVDLESSARQIWFVVEWKGRSVLVPFTDGFAEVDLKSRRVVVNAPEGFFEDDAVGR